MELFTIGHSNHSLDAFLSLLKQHNINALADVRSHPYSKFLPHFKQKNLKQSLLAEGIQYVFLGQELGARPNNLQCYINGKAVYEKIAQTPEFKSGIERILTGTNKYKIALMCAEKDPIDCHRAVLVCQHLQPFNLDIQHILKDGTLETHHHLEDRILIKQGFKQLVEPNDNNIQLSLFPLEKEDKLDRQECLQKAYQLQGDKIAYVEKQDNNNNNDSDN